MFPGCAPAGLASDDMVHYEISAINHLAQSDHYRAVVTEHLRNIMRNPTLEVKPTRSGHTVIEVKTHVISS